MLSSMRIAFFGSRGIPARYSGFETFVEQVAVRLVARGHEVTVYNRTPFNPYRSPTFKGVRIVALPTLPTKATDTIAHTFLSTLHSLGESYDIAYFCGVGNALLSVIPRLRGGHTVVNVDGADFARAKWSGFGRWWLHHSESWAGRLAEAVIADNGTIRDRYLHDYGVATELIPYGANIVRTDPGQEALEEWGLTSKSYFLYVSRLTPENAADLMIEAYRASQAQLPLVVVGDAPYQSAFIQKLRALAAPCPRVIMTGYLFGDTYQQLSYHARAFILPTAFNATRPVLLDQMGFGNCIIVRDTPGNLEVTADSALTFSHTNPVASLAAALRQVEAEPELARQKGDAARNRVAAHYDWEVITTRYEELFRRLSCKN